MEELHPSHQGYFYFEEDHFSSLPPHITHLLIDGGCKAKIKNIPASVTHMRFVNDFNKKVKLSSGVVHLVFGNDYNQPTIIPPSVKYLVFGYMYNYPIDLPETLASVKFGHCYNHPLVLPPNVETVQFGGDFNHPIVLPDGIIDVAFGYSYNQPTKFPKSIQHIVLGRSYYQDTIFPDHIKTLKCEYFKPQWMPQLFNNFFLTTLVVKFITTEYSYLCHDRLMVHVSINKHNNSMKHMTLFNGAA